jgi:DNA-binding transcriptional ArsR family regulator
MRSIRNSPPGSGLSGVKTEMGLGMRPFKNNRLFDSRTGNAENHSMNPDSQIKNGARLAQAEAAAAARGARTWTLLSNHGHVLVCIAQDPDARLRDVAQAVGITERAVQKIVADLEEGGLLSRRRDGRRNHYRVYMDRPLRHPIESHRSVGELLDTVMAHSSRRIAEG